MTTPSSCNFFLQLTTNTEVSQKKKKYSHTNFSICYNIYVIFLCFAQMYIMMKVSKHLAEV